MAVSTVFNSITRSVALATSLVAADGAGAGSTTPGSYDYQVVRHNASNAHYETFYGNEWGTIALEGDCTHPAQDIDLWVYDSANNLVASSTSYGCYEEVSIYPHHFNQQYKIVVENSHKPFDTGYVLSTW